MIHDYSDYSSSDTEDVSTISSMAAPSSVASSGCNRPRQRRPFFESDTVLFVDDINKEHAYSFMARCVACPISQPLFSRSLMAPRDKQVNCENLEQIAMNCKVHLELKFPVPATRGSVPWTPEMYIRKRYVNPDKDYDFYDIVVLWLYCQVTPSCGDSSRSCDIGSLGPAFRLVKDSPGGRKNGFKLSSLVSITKSYIEYLCKREHKPYRIEETVNSVKELVFRNMSLTTEPTRELSHDYYYELLQRLLHVTAQRHKLIYNKSRLNSMEAQIVRLRSEIDDRDTAMLLNQRRSSAQYSTDCDAEKALFEHEENLRQFKERVQHGVSADPSRVQHVKKERTHTLSGTVDKPTPTSFNEFKIKLSVWQVETSELPQKTQYFCSTKCSGSENRYRSEYKLLGEEGKMQFGSEFNFKTRRPSPVLKIKLKELKDGLFSYGQKCIASKSISPKLNIRYNKSCSCAWKKEPMRLDTGHSTSSNVIVEYKYEVTFSEAIKMLGWLTVSAKSGSWKEKRRNFFILYKGTGLEDHGLQEIGKDGHMIRSITQLTEYDVINTTNDEQNTGEHELQEMFGFTLFREGEEIYFYAPSQEEKSYWVHEIFLLTKQTHETDDRSRSSTSGDGGGIAPISEGRFWHPTDITAMQGRHSKYFTEITNSMIDYNMETERPVADGKLHEAHEALLLEYKHRYDISNGLYYVSLLEGLTRKVEEGYYVDDGLLQNVLEEICNSALRLEQQKIKEDSIQRLFEYIKQSLRFIFLKFPYDIGENQLFGYSLLLQRLSEDLEKHEEVGDLGELMMKEVEISIAHEYEKHIAPSHLVDLGLDKYKYKELPQELKLTVVQNLMSITIKFLMFVENFITFYSDNLMKHYKDIDESKIKDMCETMFRLYNQDLQTLVAFLPPCEGVFDLYDILNQFCTNVPYLQFGTFHKESLHSAFLVHVLTLIEYQANQIVTQTDQYFDEETWALPEGYDFNQGCVGFECKSVRTLNQQLASFKAYIDNLQWPNPDFRTMFAEMAEEKTSQILVKYGNVIHDLIATQVKRTRGIPNLSLIMFNSLLALYSAVPAVLDPTNELDIIVQRTLVVLASSLEKYLKKILYEWSGPCIVAAISSHVMGIKNKLVRVKEFLVTINQKTEWVSTVLHPDFSDTYLHETYKILLEHILLWLNDVKANKRCYPAQVYVTRELVDKLRDIFNTSRRHIVPHIPSQHSRPNCETYTSIDNLLRAEEVQLLDKIIDHGQLQEHIRRMLTE